MAKSRHNAKLIEVAIIASVEIVLFLAKRLDTMDMARIPAR